MPEANFCGAGEISARPAETVTKLKKNSNKVMPHEKQYQRKYIDIGRGYHVDVKNILSAIENKQLLLDDQIVNVFSKMTTEEYFKSSAEPEEHMHIFVEVLRWEIESDADYESRMQREERERVRKEQNDKDEYIRLKAKFE